jgi:hypothetical protein
MHNDLWICNDCVYNIGDGDEGLMMHTCNNHDYNATETFPCRECGTDHDGIDPFSWGPCERCGDTKGGQRTRYLIIP